MSNFNFQEMADHVLNVFPNFCSMIIQSIVIIVIFTLLYKVCNRDGILLRHLENKSNSAAASNLCQLVSKILHIVVLLVGALTLAGAWGFNLNAVLASLGICSMALALAAQDSVKNFFGAFVILLENTFKVGDKITVTGITGVVEAINFRSTVVKTESGEKIYIPNATFSGTAITNHSQK